jgi:D-alanyl-D-alanine dipeptidase
MVHGAIKKLILVQDSLKNIHNHNGISYPAGLGLKIWDGYRPRAIQYLMFEIFPDPTYVADPGSGSIHNRGGAVDLTLVDMATGEELELPTEFDYFGERAWHGYSDLPAHVIANRELLRSLMTEIAGFETYSKEWWHYTYNPSKSFPLQDFQMK